MFRGLILWFCIGGISITFGYGQKISNPSFEGQRGPSISPPMWMPCGRGSTPDTQPGVWNVSTPPVHGNSYLSLICRGKDVPFSNKWESCSQDIEGKLLQNVCYLLSVDLARSEEFYAGGCYFNKPALFKLWGANSLCSKSELLWQSPLIEETEWRNYQFIIRPQKSSYTFIIIESYYQGDLSYSGNILIDNFYIYPEEEPCQPHALNFPIFKADQQHTSLCFYEYQNQR